MKFSWFEHRFYEPDIAGLISPNALFFYIFSYLFFILKRSVNRAYYIKRKNKYFHAYHVSKTKNKLIKYINAYKKLKFKQFNYVYKLLLLINLITIIIMQFISSYLNKKSNSNFNMLFKNSTQLIKDLDETDNKLCFNDNVINELSNNKQLVDNKKLYVISMFGKARIGKSSYLNTFCSKLLDENVDPFNVASGIKHCTKGINFNIIINDDIVMMLCDFRGSDHGDSKQDLYLSMFAYSISDVLIINEKTMLYNSTLKINLEPSVIFAANFETFNKNDKYLLFRIIDSSLLDEGTDVTDAVHEILNDEVQDQYCEIKKAIKKLYKTENIKGIETTCDRADTNNLNKHCYLELLSTSENKFDKSIDTIVSIISSIKKKNITFDGFIHYLSKTVELVNKNKKIDAKIFDNYTIYYDNEITKWMNDHRKTIVTLETHIDEKLLTTGLKITYDTNIEKYKQLTLMLSEFDSEFEKTTDTIKKPKRDELKNNIYDVISSDGIKLCKSACDIMLNNFNVGINNVLTFIMNYVNKNLDFSDYKKLKNDITEFTKHAFKTLYVFQNIYCPKATRIMNETIGGLEKNINKYILENLEKEYKNNYIPYTTFIDDNKKTMKSIIKDKYNKSTINPLKTFIEDDFYSYTLTLFNEMINGMSSKMIKHIYSFNCENIIKNIKKCVDMSLDTFEFDWFATIKYYSGDIDDAITTTQQGNKKYYDEIGNKYVKDYIINELNECKSKYNNDKVRVLREYCESDCDNDIAIKNPDHKFIKTCSFARNNGYYNPKFDITANGIIGNKIMLFSSIQYFDKVIDKVIKENLVLNGNVYTFNITDIEIREMFVIRLTQKYFKQKTLNTWKGLYKYV